MYINTCPDRLMHIFQVSQTFHKPSSILFLFFAVQTSSHVHQRHGALYYEWRLCNSAFPKWIGLIVNGPWWFISAYTQHLLFIAFQDHCRALKCQHIIHFTNLTTRNKHKTATIRRAGLDGVVCFQFLFCFVFFFFGQNLVDLFDISWLNVMHKTDLQAYISLLLWITYRV